MSKLNNKTAFIFMTAALIVLIVIGTVLSRPDYTPAEKYMKKYFPDCYKNPYVKLRRFKNMNFVQRGGTWIFVQGMKFHCLGVISEILSVF